MNNYFCGWYYKCQNGEKTLAVIPAYHISNGKKTCSIQLITESGVWSVPFSYAQFQKTSEGVDIGENHFGFGGLRLMLEAPGLQAKGSVAFGPFLPLRRDIMGPFRFVPGMECRHRVFSMDHSVTGHITVNGTAYEFDRGRGYLEGDRGRSFPGEYAWTQCLLPQGSLMLSVADIPFLGRKFTGIIAAVVLQGREYRLATYLGARVEKIRSGEVVIRQGDQRLTVRRLNHRSQPLAAPVNGEMIRTIHETPACRAYYHYQQAGKTILETEVDNASFEYEYPQ